MAFFSARPELLRGQQSNLVTLTIISLEQQVVVTLCSLMH